MKKIIILFALCIFFISCNKTPKEYNPNMSCEDKIKNTNQVLVFSQKQEKTPKGALIASLNGVSEDFKNRVDSSLDKVFADATRLGYTNVLNHADYTIYALHNCQPSPEQKIPSFLVRDFSNTYDGSIYDQDSCPGFTMLFAAEMVIKDGTILSKEYIVCNDLSSPYLENVVRYGAEHIMLYNNDMPKYLETEAHLSIGHPIIPEN